MADTERKLERLSALIEEEIMSGRIQLKASNLKEIKNICRINDDFVKEAYRLLRQRLEMEHSEARWSAFLLIKELFDRSHVFRLLLIDDINEYLILVAEIDGLRPLPPPKSIATRLKEEAISLFTGWYMKFGAAYKKLALAFTFLRDTQRIQLPNPSDSQVTISVRAPDDRLSALSPVNRKKLDQVAAEREECTEELSTILTELNNLFRLVIPDFGDDTSYIPQALASNSDDLRYHGLFHTSHTQVVLQPSSLRVERSPENDIIVDKIEENSILLNKKFLPQVLQWLRILSKIGVDEQTLKVYIDLKQTVENALRKAARLGIDFTKSVHRSPSDSELNMNDEDGEDAFEEVPEKEGLELIIPPNKRLEYGLEMISQNVQESSTELRPSSSKMTFASKPSPVSTNKTSEDNLLSKTPIVPYGPDLEDWGKAKDLPATSFQSPFDALHRFWRPSEVADDFTNQEVVAAGINRFILFAGKFEPVKWFCRAPLPSGQLCSRMDREKCPFHGTIIARGTDGVPTLEEDRLREVRAKERIEQTKIPDWQDPELLRDIKAATGLDLKVEKRKKRKKEGNLTDVKKFKSVPRSRLEKIVLNKSTVNRIADEMDHRQKTAVAEKFAHNWNYSSL